MSAFKSPDLPTPLHKWASLRTELMWVYKGLVAPDNRSVTTDHRSGYWLWLIYAGQVSLQMGEKSWEAKAGQWIISPQGKTQQEFSTDARILSLHFRCQWPTGENLFAGTDAVVLESKEFPRLERSAVALQKLAHRHFPRIRGDFSLQTGDLPIFLSLQQLFFQLLLEFYEAMVSHERFASRAGSGDDRLVRAARILHETSLDQAFPADRLRKETGLGRAHLDRLYWREYGVSTRVNWERLREESAMRSLESANLSIKEIGYGLGFRQASHFTKWFRHRLELTPTQYRFRALERSVADDDQHGPPPDGVSSQKEAASRSLKAPPGKRSEKRITKNRRMII